MRYQILLVWYSEYLFNSWSLFSIPPGASECMTGLCTPQTIILDDPNFVVCFFYSFQNQSGFGSYERSITDTHTRYIFFHMLLLPKCMWKMLCRRVPFERNHTNEALFQTYLDYLRALLFSGRSRRWIKYENCTKGISRNLISIPCYRSILNFVSI